MEILFQDMWHHQIWGQFAGYAAGYAASSVHMLASVYILKYLCYVYFRCYACLKWQRSLNSFLDVYTTADMWHHQIFGQFAGYASGYAASSMVIPPLQLNRCL